MEGLEKLILDPTEPDDDDVRHNDSGEDGDSPRHVVESGDPGAPSMAPPRMRRKGNTGVKGVLADYAEAQDRARAKREYEKARVWDLIGNEAKSVVPQNVDNSNDKDDEFLLEEDDPMLREFRQQRLGEILLKQKRPALAKPPTFGFLAGISRREYVTAIDKEHPSVFVVVHLYQTHVPACVRMNNYLSRIAIRHPHVKFMKILSTDAKPDFADEGLPALLIYRDKDLFTSFVPVTEKIPEDFEEDDVELLLQRFHVIDAQAQTKEKKATPAKKRDDSDESEDD